MALNNNLRGIFFAMIGFSSYSFMDGAIKYILDSYHLPWQFLIFYVALTVLIVLFLIILLDKKQTFKVHAPVALVFRSIFGVATLNLVFFILPFVPLDLFYSLVFVSPVIASILAIFFLNEHLNFHKLVSIIGGFIGILIITQPWSILSSNISLFIIIVPLLCACGDASIGIIARKYLVKDKPLTLVFYQFILTTSLGATLLFIKLHTIPLPSTHYILPILVTAFFTMLGYLFYIKAVQIAPIQIVLPLGYCQIIFGIIISIFLLNQYPKMNTIIGAIVIIFSSLYISLYASFTKGKKEKRKWNKYSFVIKKLTRKLLRILLLKNRPQ